MPGETETTIEDTVRARIAAAGLPAPTRVEVKPDGAIRLSVAFAAALSPEALRELNSITAEVLRG